MAPRDIPLAPIELVVLQGTSFCNLNCAYCDLSPASRRARRIMSPETIDRVFTELFTSGRLAAAATVIWHSGEPLTLPPSYYDEAIERIFRLRNAFAIRPVELSFDIQTNGVLIDEAWCELFRRRASHLGVGVSCDGPAGMHDAFRVNWGGAGSHAKVLRGMELLKRHGIRFKVIAVVSERTLEDPEAFFEFFYARREMLSGFHFNVLADGSASDDAALTYNSADRERYRAFYRKLLDLCRAAEAQGGGFAVQTFTQGLARILNAGADGDSSFAGEGSAPLKSFNVDSEGNATTFYAGLAPDAHPNQYGDGRGLCLGNIFETSLEEMICSAKLQRIAADFERSRRACRRACAYFAVCPGGFELTKLSAHGGFDGSETPECVIHVKALTDALLDDLSEQLDRVAADPAGPSGQFEASAASGLA